MTSAIEHSVPGPTNNGDGAEKLLLELDVLFEQYLNLLDQYQKIRQQLSTQLSSGYISLAQANFASASRARYGPDYYDERMQASREITIAEKNVGREDFVVNCSLNPGEQSKRDTESESVPTEPDSEEAKDNATPTKIEADVNVKPKIDQRDPIRWFGLLVPPPLRSAQSKFIAIVEGPVPQLINLTKELRALEIEIGRTRKSIRKIEKY
ncbi:hypothetical protein E2P81_ATG09655 [Venturia nashicola]|uniref:Vacuolar ATPase assembly protein VMA22 n=1 Tax=Venturia nashicola TaxID=86259 RepID=A0A4Z1P8X2_9PEZI|nr:hypothetical protein E6O75_ATG09866 [Venturia nashicola]TLD25998.1 hypothetical protein E2P81_ATG09655 [Venturia nashicola]